VVGNIAHDANTADGLLEGAWRHGKGERFGSGVLDFDADLTGAPGEQQADGWQLVAHGVGHYVFRSAPESVTREL
jgi:hypothetical protein